MNDQHESIPSAVPGDGEGHILVVDDDGQIRQLAAKFLRENGLRVTTARDGREMRQALADAAIDLISSTSCSLAPAASTSAANCARLRRSRSSC